MISLYSLTITLFLLGFATAGFVTKTYTLEAGADNDCATQVGAVFFHKINACDFNGFNSYSSFNSTHVAISHCTAAVTYPPYEFYPIGECLNGLTFGVVDEVKSPFGAPAESQFTYPFGLGTYNCSTVTPTVVWMFNPACEVYEEGSWKPVCGDGKTTYNLYATPNCTGDVIETSEHIHNCNQRVGLGCVYEF